MKIPGWTSGVTKKYSSPGYGISLEYPKTWKKKEGNQGLVVMFLAPKGTGGLFQANLNVTVQGLTETDQDLDGYVRSMTEKEKEVIPEYQLQAVEEAELAGRPARRIVSTAKQGHVTLKLLQLCAIVPSNTGARAYAITFAAEENRFAELWPTVEAIINSFNIDN